MGFFDFFRFNNEPEAQAAPVIEDSNFKYPSREEMPLYRGHLDGYRNGVVGGWAFNPDDIHTPVKVKLLVDGREVAVTLADNERKDLLVKPIGNGRCAFRFEVPEELIDGNEHFVQVVYADTDEDVKSSPKTVLFVKEKASTTPLTPEVTNPDNPNIGSLEGKSGWYYLVNDTNRCMDQFRGLVRFSAEEIAQYQQIFESRGNYFKEKNIPYICSIVPGKETVYSEFLPAGIEKGKLPSPLDQLLKATSGIKGVEMLDLRTTLLASKHLGQLYYNFDTHWTPTGAFLGYLAIMEKVKKHFPKIQPMRFEAMNRVSVQRNVSDLVVKTQYNFKDAEFVKADPQKVLEHETSLQLYPKGGFTAKPAIVPEHLKVSKTRATIIYEKDDPTLPTAVVFRDSAGDWIIPFLSEHFRRILYMASAHQ